MKIEHDDGLRGLTPQANPVHGARQDSSRKTRHAGSDGSDRVEVSERARALQSAREALLQLPEIRADRVSQLKQQVKDGSYRIPGEAVAERLLEEGIFA